MKSNNLSTQSQMPQQDIGLWMRISKLNMDDPNSSPPFSHKLAKEHNWSRAFTLRAIDEYKRFVYLCCIAPQGASPPPIVDEVWHLHLQYTRNYWDEFCAHILKRKLHHEPATGGFAAKQKHQDWRQDTLQLYQQIFHINAPADIWLDTPRKSTHWKSYLIRKFYLLLLLVIICTTTGCENAGPHLLILGIIALFLGLPTTFPSESTRNNPNPDKNKKGDGSCGSSGCSSSSCGSGGCGGGGCGS